MTPNLHENLPLATEAADWVLRRMEDHSPECSAQFLHWLRKSPRHIEEYLLVVTSCTALSGDNTVRSFSIEGLLQPLPGNVVHLDPPPDGSMATACIDHDAADTRDHMPAELSSCTGRRRIAGLRAVGATAMLSFGLWMVWPYMSTDTYTTGVGEQRIVRLEDGSLLHLNTRTRVEATFSSTSRELRLVRGEALFTVARDKVRPFRVLTPTAVIQAVGTQFNVYEYGQQTKISVVEGRVRVATRPNKAFSVAVLQTEEHQAPEGQVLMPAAPALLVKGEQAEVNRSGGIHKHALPDIDAVLAWQQRRLIFRSAPLAEVTREFNRYNDYQIRIGDPELAQRLIWGVFPVDEPQALVKFLAQDASLILEAAKDGVLVRLR